LSYLAKISGTVSYGRSVFETAVQRYDPLLSIRWGQTLNQWVLERKAVIPDNEMAYLKSRMDRTYRLSRDTNKPEKDRKRLYKSFQQIREEFLSAQTSKRVILFASILGDEVFDAIRLSDIKAYGGYSRFADELERYEAEAKQKQVKAIQEVSMDIHREVYDIINFLRRKPEPNREDRDLKKLLGKKKVL